jgi:hypothetical protein
MAASTVKRSASKEGREDELTRRELDRLRADEASIRVEERVYIWRP